MHCRCKGQLRSVEPFLEAVSIPMEHRSPWFLSRADVLFLMEIIWLFVAAASMNELGPKADGSRTQKHAE